MRRPGYRGRAVPGLWKVVAVSAAPQPVGRAPLGASGDGLVGRDEELALARQLLQAPASRLLTIAGLAGVGKTRLAQELLQVLAAEGRAGLLVELTGIGDVQVIGDRIIEAIGPTLATTPAQAIWERFGGADLTLVLDDLDQVDGAAPLVEHLLEGYPGAHVVITRARPLGVPGEVVVRLRPLALPDVSATPDEALRSPAVALFIRRALMVDAAFTVTEGAVAGVVAACRAVGGLPLAIELAASRSASIPPAVMAQQLTQPAALGLLHDASGSRDHRHASIEATLGWACDQLAPSVRHDLLQLSVFEGSFDLEAARDVLAPRAEHTAEALDRLSPLVDCHLVDLTATDPDAPRFAMTAIVRSFARSRLGESGELGPVLRRHSSHFQARCQAGRSVSAEEIGDILAALDRAIIDGGADEGLHSMVEAAVALSSFPATARALGTRLDGLVSRDETVGDDADVARALTLAATFGEDAHGDQPYAAWLADRVDAAVAVARRSGDRQALLESLQLRIRAMPMTLDLAGGIAATHEGLQLALACGDERALARFELYSAMTAQSMGDQATAARYASSAWTRAQDTEDPATVLQAALELHRLPAHLTAGGPEPPTLEALLAACEAAREPLVGFFVLAALAVRDTAAGSPDAAARWVHRGLLVSQGWHRTRPLVPIGCVALLVPVALMRGDLEQAVRLRTGIAAHDGALAAMPHVVGAYPAACTRLAAEVPQEQWAAWATGPAGFTPEQATRAALAYVHAVLAGARAATPDGAAPPGSAEPALHPGPTAGPVDGAGLTPREREVLAQLAAGGSNKEIARTLGMRPKTVMHHSMAIYRKLGVRGRGEAAAWAYRHGALAGSDPPAEPRSARS
jgi:predicted ATPase/DNA-binding CsgD family transcriptional regulator